MKTNQFGGGPVEPMILAGVIAALTLCRGPIGEAAELFAVFAFLMVVRLAILTLTVPNGAGLGKVPPVKPANVYADPRGHIGNLRLIGPLVRAAMLLFC